MVVGKLARRSSFLEPPGRVLAQTFCPDAPAIVRAREHDYLGFVQGELLERRDKGLPPYGRLARLITRGPDEGEVKRFLDGLAAVLRAQAAPEVRFMGPAAAPVSRIKDLFRFHLRLRLQAPTARLIQELLHAVRPPGEVELAVDVDPVSLL